MGKVVTIYLSDEEVSDLKGFCDENQCTQYSALKTAVKQLLYRTVESVYEESWIEDTSVDVDKEEDTEIIEEVEEIEEVAERERQERLLTLAQKLRSANKKQKEL